MDSYWICNSSIRYNSFNKTIGYSNLYSDRYNNRVLFKCHSRNQCK